MAPCYKTFISLGNSKQHFSRLLEAVKAYATLLPKPILVQCGHTPTLQIAECDVIDFISMDTFTQMVANAEILILHAGAGSVLHAVKSGKRPIVMPRRAVFNEHINDHQLEFAKALNALGKVVMIEEAQEMVGALGEVRKEVVVGNNQNSQLSDAIKNLLGQLFAEK